MDRSWTTRLRQAVSLALLTLATACGQVVTVQPSPTSTPVEAPAATLGQPTPDPATQTPVHRPADTATPTISPTPIIHVVGKGDTLQAIAFDFGVSVQALQSANGIENPQFLQVGQRLVIPVERDADQTTLGQLLPTPTPHPVRVQGFALYETPVDSLLGLGEVANTTPYTLTNVEVQTTLLSADGSALAHTTSFVSMDVVPAKSRCPFGILFTEPPAGWATYHVHVIRAQEAGVLATAYVPLSVAEVEGRPAGPQFEVNGRVQNRTAGQAADSVEIVVTTYDASDLVTGFRRAEVPSTSEGGALAPGEQRAFSLSLITQGGAPAEFAVVAVGRKTGGVALGG